MILTLKTLPWFIAGPAIAMIMITLLFLGKKFGMSSNLRTICTALGANKTCDFFKFDWKSQRWNLIIVFGAMIGGYIAFNFIIQGAPELNPDVIHNLNDLGFKVDSKEYLPVELFGINSLQNPKTITLLLIGGFLVGFGARFAGGCTSGHAISGLSNLQLPSLIAVVGFFIGGLIMVHLIFPLIF